MGIFNCFTSELMSHAKRELEIYREKEEQFIEFKIQPYKYEIGLNILNVVIIDRKKDGYVDAPYSGEAFNIPCLYNWEDKYKIVNTLTGDVSFRNESYIDDLIEAERLIQRNEKK